MLKIALLPTTISFPCLELGVQTQSCLPELRDSQDLVSRLISKALGESGAGAASVGLAPSPRPPPWVPAPHPCCTGAHRELSCPLWDMEMVLPRPQPGSLPSPSTTGCQPGRFGPPPRTNTSTFKSGTGSCSLASLCSTNKDLTGRCFGHEQSCEKSLSVATFSA